MLVKRFCYNSEKLLENRESMFTFRLRSTKLPSIWQFFGRLLTLWFLSKKYLNAIDSFVPFRLSGMPFGNIDGHSKAFRPDVAFHCAPHGWRCHFHSCRDDKNASQSPEINQRSKILLSLRALSILENHQKSRIGFFPSNVMFDQGTFTRKIVKFQKLNFSVKSQYLLWFQ